MKAAIIVDDWKLRIFRKRLTDAGFEYVDGGAGPGRTTILTVETDDLNALKNVIVAAQAECEKTKP